MGIAPIASRQQLHDELLSLIGSRTKADASAQAQSGAGPDQAADAAAAPVAPVQTQAAVKAINKALETLGTSLHFEVDQDSNEVVVKVIDRDSGQVLRQIPSEATLQFARSLDRMAGHLIDHSI